MALVSSPFTYMPFWNSPQSQKSEKMHLVRTSCSSTGKTSTVIPIYYFMILIRSALPFDEKKN